MQTPLTSCPATVNGLIDRGSASATHFICSSETRMMLVAAVDTWPTLALKLVSKSLAFVI